MLKNLYLSTMKGDSSDEIIEVFADEEENKDRPEIPNELGILPVRNTVLFPGVVIPITVGREKSIRLVKKVYKSNKLIGVLAQKNGDIEEPTENDLYGVGTVAKILKLIPQSMGNITIIIQGKARFEVEQFLVNKQIITAKIKLNKSVFDSKNTKQEKALMQSLKDAATKILHLNPEIPQDAQMALDNISDLKFLTHILASNLNSEVEKKQKILEVNDGYKRATQLLEFMHDEIQLLELKYDIHKKVHTDIDQQQRDFYLRQQIKVIQDELGNEGPEREIEHLTTKGDKKIWSDTIKLHFKKELDKLSRTNPQAADYPVILNYIELMLELPWNVFTKDNLNLKRAIKILNSNHYGMEKIKERILEYLAVLKLKNDMKAPILCFYGPPGVGKTSLGKSIAKALNRKYVRMSLGGIHDEAEIRGHRKTYVGALPGKIIQNIKKSKSSNPVIVLDEIDKINTSFRGDPSSALLEVLDPEQNFEFRDNYLDLDYDLSKVLFIATANSIDTIQPALRDRMELVEISGYTLEEKIEIAKKHLIPKQILEHGIAKDDITITKNAIVKLIEGYTRESGVRSLERKIGSVIRNVAKFKALEDEYSKNITEKEIVKILGVEIYQKELYQDDEVAGVVTGLAWTQVGGEILFIESSLSKGKGKLTLSGQLGDVMKESAVAALSYLKANADNYDIDSRVFDHYDLHIHVPAGAVPKDGPSAGITMLTSMTSVFTQRKVKTKLAMTGEITLRGKVLPVGGIKEKILAARRAGVTTIILSEKNKRDITEIDKRYIKNLDVFFVENVKQVLEHSLMKEKVKNQLKFIFPDKK